MVMQSMCSNLWLAVFFLPALLGAVSIGQVDTFEDGTTQNWTVAVGPLGGLHPSPPANIATGGPAGADDNFLQLTSIGGGGAGSRLVALNLTQWAGDYTAAGVTSISLDARNLGNSDLTLRLLFEDPIPGPPLNIAVTAPFFLPAGGDWTSVTFLVDAANLTAIQGDVNTLLQQVTMLRILHSPNAVFPPPEIIAQLGVDNISANGAATPIPEPGSVSLAVLGAAMLTLLKRGSAR
jgi:hypothetical protein